MTIYKKHKKSVNFSKEYRRYLKKQKTNKITIIVVQLIILVLLIGMWELFAQLNLINTFFISSPSRILKTFIEYHFMTEHILVTLWEAVISFIIATFGGTFIAILLWWNGFLRKVLDPYIVVLNSLPKIALGPLIIIMVGIGTEAIVVMAVLIMIIITILTMLHNFMMCDKSKLLLMQSLNANRFQILTKLILPNALPEFMSLMKINVGLTWVGTIMGEYLVSRAGLGYLIIYGGQVFKLDLVMTSTVMLCALAALMYFALSWIEKLVKKGMRR